MPDREIGPDGNLVYTIIPDTGSVTLGLDDLASGCDGGSFTLQGLMLAGVLAIGALAVAGLCGGWSRGAHATRAPEPLP